MITAPQQTSSAREIAYPRDGGFVMRLLIIEDDRDAADYLAKAFREVGHVADLAADGEEGLAHALDGQYDVLIVDRMLPKLDGLTVIGTLRSKGIETPALILSALGQVDDRVKGLRAGTTICPSPIRSRSCSRAPRCWRGGAAAARRRSTGSATSSSTGSRIR